MLNFLLNILFEERCVGCKKSGSPLCVACASSAEPATEPNDTDVWSAYAFHDPVIKKSLQKLKYHGKKIVAESLAEALYDRALETIGEKRLSWGLGQGEKIIIIPVPLSASRFAERGYNQAELIAEAFIRLDNSMSFSVLNDVLYKNRDTASQVSVKDRGKRLRNIIGAFEIKNKEKILDKCCILIDDVTTTGATLAECRKVLKKSGAREVFAITVAH
ncbi:MAG: phosphoribosyltransferase family protein [Candidatus Paceibacterota bacterium]|jgi:competence protein ComFC